MALTPIVAPDRPVQAYGLHCRFVTDPRPTETQFTAEAAKAEARFARDMARQGWVYSGRVVRFMGPYPPTPRFAPPKRKPAAAKPGVHGVTEPGAAQQQYTTTQAPLWAADRWEWEMVAVFTRRAFWVEHEVEAN